MFYTKDENGLVFCWEDNQKDIVPEVHVAMDDVEVASYIDGLKPKPSGALFKSILQNFCDDIATKFDDGNYKNSNEILLYSLQGDNKAKEFADWYNKVWELKVSLKEIPKDINAWIEELPKLVV